MSARAVLAVQIRAIHAIKTRVRLDDSSYRAMLQGYGASSSKHLTADDAERLLARLRQIPGADRPIPPSERPSTAKADGPYAAKMRAMWIAGHNLGLIRDPSDKAMHAFGERQTGIPHSRWLRHAADARLVIEALKSWLERGGVVWPDAGLDRAEALLAVKRAILRAQWLRCIALGAVEAFGPPEECDGLQDYVSSVLRGGPRRLGAIDDPALTPADLDKAAKALGAKLRRGQAVAAEKLTEARHGRRP